MSAGSDQSLKDKEEGDKNGPTPVDLAHSQPAPASEEGLSELQNKPAPSSIEAEIKEGNSPDKSSISVTKDSSELTKGLTHRVVGEVNWLKVWTFLGLLAALSAAVGYQIVARSDSDSSLLAKTKQKLESGQYDEAMQAASIGVARFPYQPYFHFYKSQLLNRKQLKKEALDEIMLACHALPNDLELIAYRAQLRLECGDLQAALADFERLSTNRSWLDKPSIIVGKVKVETLMGSLKRALDDINKALRKEPNNASYLAARAGLQTELFHFSLALNDWNRVIALVPGDAHAYSERAMLEYRNRQVDKAKDDIAKSLSIKPAAATFINRGLISKDQGSLAEASNDFLAAIKLEPNNVTAFELLGQCYGADRDFEQGIAKFDQALISIGAKDSPCYYLGHASVSMAFGRYKQALDDLAKATPSVDQERTRLRRAYCYEKLGELANAYREYSLLLDSNPQRYDFYMKRGALAIKQNRFAQAASDLDSAIVLIPDKCEPYVMQGEVFAMQKMYGRALAYYSHALELNPDNESIRAKLSACRSLYAAARTAATKQDRAALAYQSMMQGIATADLATLKRQGYASLQAGDVEYALAALRRAIKLAPNDPVLRQYMAYSLLEAGEYSQAVEQMSVWEKLSKLTIDDSLSFAKRLPHSGSSVAGDYFDGLIRQYKNDAKALLAIAKVSQDQGYEKQSQAAVEAGLQVASDAEKDQLFALRAKLKIKELRDLSHFTPAEREQLRSYVRPESSGK